MNFEISGVYQNHRITYKVMTDDFVTFELTLQHDSPSKDLFPKTVVLDRQRTTFRKSDKYLFELIDEWRNRL